MTDATPFVETQATNDFNALPDENEVYVSTDGNSAVQTLDDHPRSRNEQDTVHQAVPGTSSSTDHQQMYANFLFCNECDYIDSDQSTESDESFADQLSESKQDDHESDFVDALNSIKPEKILGDKKYERFRRVRRNYAWDDSKDKLRRLSRVNGWAKELRVDFLGDAAIDDGGPRREFVSIIHKQLQDSNLFVGITNKKCFAHNYLALKEKDYELYGNLVVWTILQGCQPPSFLSAPVTDYIIYGKLDKVRTDIDVVPDYEVRELLKTLKNLDDVEEFERQASMADIRFTAGYCKTKVTIEDRDEFISSIAVHMNVINSLSEINQFIKGLELFGFLGVVRKHPKDARSIFESLNNDALTAEVLDDLFEFDFSPPGSNRRAREEAIAVNVSKYFDEVEEGLIESPIFDPATGERKEVMITLPMILQFCTGASLIPTLGFSKGPVISFNHEATDRKLQVNTCGLVLMLPVNDTLTNYASFKDEFTKCMLDSPGYGNV